MDLPAHAEVEQFMEERIDGMGMASGPRPDQVDFAAHCRVCRAPFTVSRGRLAGSAYDDDCSWSRKLALAVTYFFRKDEKL